MDVGGDAHIAPLGSCEFAEDSRKIGTSFPILADYSIFPVGNRLIYATHGHVYIYSIDYLPRALFGSRDYTRIDLRPA